MITNPELYRRTVGQTGSIKLYRRLLTYAWPYRAAFLVSILGMIMLSATAAGFAAVMKPLIDDGFVAKDPDTMRYIPPLIVAIFAVRAIGNFLAQYAISWVGRRITFDIRDAMFAHMLKLPASFYDVHASGGLISKLIFDVEQISNAVTDTIFVVVRDGLTVAALFAWMFYLNWKLTLLFLLLAPVSTTLLRIMSRRFRKTSYGIQSSMGEISQVAQETTEGHRVVKAFGAQVTQARAFSAANEQNRKQAMRKVKVSTIGIGLLQLTAAIALALVIYMAMQSPGVSAGMFVSYITATTWLMGPAKRLSKLNEVLQTGLAAADSAFTLLDEGAEQDSGKRRLAEVRGAVEYRNVSFRYATSTSEVLDDISFVVEPGQTLALVGVSGSGKTTVASLLPRFYRATGGEILLDGININDLGLADLRGHIALVGQETILFDDTIRNNIAFGREGPIDEQRLEQAARAAHVLEFVQALPQGLDTRVGEKGLLLSGGQRQRVAIARALYKNAPILILDEATSALDAESERYVQEAMQTLMRDRTTLVIAHRLSTVERADKIVVLAAGRIVEAGTHAQLLAREGIYAGLHRRQFAGA